LALLLDHGWNGRELGDLGLGTRDTLLERGDLLVGAGGTGAPALLLQADRRLPLRARAVLTLECDELGAALGDVGAQGGGLLLRRRQLGLQTFGTRK
jgi:hypothetical protein